MEKISDAAHFVSREYPFSTKTLFVCPLAGPGLELDSSRYEALNRAIKLNFLENIANNSILGPPIRFL